MVVSYAVKHPTLLCVSFTSSMSDNSMILQHEHFNEVIASSCGRLSLNPSRVAILVRAQLFHLPMVRLVTKEGICIMVIQFHYRSVRVHVLERSPLLCSLLLSSCIDHFFVGVAQPEQTLKSREMGFEREQCLHWPAWHSACARRLLLLQSGQRRSELLQHWWSLIM